MQDYVELQAHAKELATALSHARSEALEAARGRGEAQQLAERRKEIAERCKEEGRESAERLVRGEREAMRREQEERVREAVHVAKEEAAAKVFRHLAPKPSRPPSPVDRKHRHVAFSEPSTPQAVRGRYCPM